jgi:hypothetical protein
MVIADSKKRGGIIKNCKNYFSSFFAYMGSRILFLNVLAAIRGG